MQKAKIFQDWMSLFHGRNLCYLGLYLHNPDHYEKGKDEYSCILLEDGSILFESGKDPECGLLVTLLETHQFSIKSVVTKNEQLKVIEESVLYDVDAGIDSILSYIKNVVGLKAITRDNWGPARCKI